MTNLEALKAAVNYPISDANAELILIDRKLSKDSVYAGISPDFELAKADALIFLCSGGNVSEGGYSVSVSEKQIMLKIASGIYEKHGVSNPSASKIKDVSSKW